MPIRIPRINKVDQAPPVTQLPGGVGDAMERTGNALGRAITDITGSVLGAGKAIVSAKERERLAELKADKADQAAIDKVTDQHNGARVDRSTDSYDLNTTDETIEDQFAEYSLGEILHPEFVNKAVSDANGNSQGFIGQIGEENSDLPTKHQIALRNKLGKVHNDYLVRVKENAAKLQEAAMLEDVGARADERISLVDDIDTGLIEDPKLGLVNAIPEIRNMVMNGHPGDAVAKERFADEKVLLAIETALPLAWEQDPKAAESYVSDGLPGSGLSLEEVNKFQKSWESSRGKREFQRRTESEYMFSEEGLSKFRIPEEKFRSDPEGAIALQKDSIRIVQEILADPQSFSGLSGDPKAISEAVGRAKDFITRTTGELQNIETLNLALESGGKYMGGFSPRVMASMDAWVGQINGDVPSYIGRIYSVARTTGKVAPGSMTTLSKMIDLGTNEERATAKAAVRDIHSRYLAAFSGPDNEEKRTSEAVYKGLKESFTASDLKSIFGGNTDATAPRAVGSMGAARGKVLDALKTSLVDHFDKEILGEPEIGSQTMVIAMEAYNASISKIGSEQFATTDAIHAVSSRSKIPPYGFGVQDMVNLDTPGSVYSSYPETEVYSVIAKKLVDAKMLKGFDGPRGPILSGHDGISLKNVDLGPLGNMVQEGKGTIGRAVGQENLFYIKSNESVGGKPTWEVRERIIPENFFGWDGLPTQRFLGLITLEESELPSYQNKQYVDAETRMLDYRRQASIDPGSPMSKTSLYLADEEAKTVKYWGQKIDEAGGKKPLPPEKQPKTTPPLKYIEDLISDTLKYSI